MEQDEIPLITVLTPVYNGEKYLRECIESIIKQSYKNWEYIIINNCSTDRTLEIAEYYSSIDKRIRILSNSKLVDVITNHNIAFKQISSKSKYCKVVQADDWIYPQCLEQMINVAEANPSVGVVGAYSISGKGIHNQGLKHPISFMSGADIARSTLLGEFYLFWSPTSLLISSKYIRDHMPYYNESRLDADVSALFTIFQQYDFGFVHQILTYVRSHEDSMTSRDRKHSHTQLLSHIYLLLKYGPIYLKPNELANREKFLFSEYYKKLTLAIFEFKEKNFWKKQKLQLDELGYKFSYFRLFFMCLNFMLLHPITTLRKLRRTIFY